MRAFGLFILLAAAFASAPAAAQRTARAASAYTDLDLARCTILAEVEEGASVARRCPGFGGVPLFVLSGDERHDIDAGVDNGEWESPPEFSSLPQRVEWRLRGGRPFAIVYRLQLRGEDRFVHSVLIVETAGRPGAAGCRVATIRGSVRNANSFARRLADAEAARFRCGEDEEDYIIRVSG
ncbi:MAG TPA: hypothetical protein VEZ20_01300 [Allosphingosinicella sp.]|nr:hypothetical protein [Allosphingosinicella sp.]